MTSGKKHKIIITGTGRAGTTLLVELLTELGLDTGFAGLARGQGYYEHCNAGLEHDIESPGAPYIVKNPELCETLPDVLARGLVTIDFAVIPVRQLDSAAASRVRVGGTGSTPGGLRGTGDPSKQKAVLAENFYQLVETLTSHDIPHAFLQFPRFAHDARYAFEKLRPVLGSITYAQFESGFAKVAKPELIHSFTTPIPTDSNTPARSFRRSYWQKRARRWASRSVLFAAFFAVGWWSEPRLSHQEGSFASFNPSSLPPSPYLFAYNPFQFHGHLPPPPNHGPIPGFGGQIHPSPRGFHFPRPPFAGARPLHFPAFFAGPVSAAARSVDLDTINGLDFFAR